jgi:hypothetical protein
VPHPGLRATVAWAAARLALGPPPPLGGGRGGGSSGASAAALTPTTTTQGGLSRSSPSLESSLGPPVAAAAASSLVCCDPFCGRGSLGLELLRGWRHQISRLVLGDAALLPPPSPPSPAAAAEVRRSSSDGAMGADGSSSSAQPVSPLLAELQANLRGCAAGGGRQLGGAIVNPGPGVIIDVLAMDARVLPLRTGSVDVLLTDPPFGRQHGDERSVRALYPAALREMRRVVRADTGVLVMLCPARHWQFFQGLVVVCDVRMPSAEMQESSSSSCFVSPGGLMTTAAPHRSADLHERPSGSSAPAVVGHAAEEEPSSSPSPSFPPPTTTTAASSSAASSSSSSSGGGWRLECALPVKLGQVHCQLCRLRPCSRQVPAVAPMPPPASGVGAAQPRLSKRQKRKLLKRNIQKRKKRAAAALASSTPTP